MSWLCIRWPKYQIFSFLISISSGYSGLISFRIDWFDLLAVQGTLKSLIQHHHLKTSFFGYVQRSLVDYRELDTTEVTQHRCTAFFMVQLPYPCMTTGKTIALTIQTFVSKCMSLLFNVLSWFITAFLPRRKHLVIYLINQNIHILSSHFCDF